jgi:osmotically-inducible protein OsmY
MRNDISQSEVVSAVRDALAADPEVGPWASHMRVSPGDPWRIDGEVGSVAARRKAVRVARRVLPTVDFADGVRLTPRIHRPDEVLADNVRVALRAESAFAEVPVIEPGTRPPPPQAPWIGVLAHDAVVYLGGRLDSAGRSLAEALAWETAACADVVNLISRERRTGSLDNAITEALNTLMAEHRGLFWQRIRVGASRGEITLRGQVEEPGQRAVAVGLCWLVPDVLAVHDQLKTVGERGDAPP